MAPTFTDSPTYAVRLGTDPNTLNNPVIEAGLVEPALDVNGLLDEGTTYFWSVDASNGETYGSDDWSFTTYVIPDNLSGPYALDADTLHLWHLERQLENPPELDPDDWYLDSAFPDSNDPTVWTDLITPHGDRRDSLPGFGYAFHTYTHLGSPSGVTSKYVEPQSEFQSEDGAFTYEGIIVAFQGSGLRVGCCLTTQPIGLILEGTLSSWRITHAASENAPSAERGLLIVHSGLNFAVAGNGFSFYHGKGKRLSVRCHVWIQEGPNQPRTDRPGELTQVAGIISHPRSWPS